MLAVKTGRGQQISKVNFKLDKIAEVMGRQAIGTRLIDFNKNIEMEWAMPKDDNPQQDLFD